MTSGVRGRLLTTSFLRDLFPSLPGAEPPPRQFLRALAAWWERCDGALGPASSVRAIADVAVIPLLHLLDLSVVSRVELQDGCLLHTSCTNRQGPQVLVVGWNQPLSLSWRESVLGAIADRRTLVFLYQRHGIARRRLVPNLVARVSRARSQPRWRRRGHGWPALEFLRGTAITAESADS